MIKAKIGSKVWSGYFDAWLTIVEFHDKGFFWFRDPKDRHLVLSQTPIEWFEERELVK